ncbi:site-specific integrase [soil metagenome]
MGMLYRRTRRHPDGTVTELPTWWIKYYQHGRAVRESTKTGKETVARRILRSREGDVEHGVPINPKMGLVTFEEAAADLGNDYNTNRRKTLDHTKRRIAKHLTPHFAGKRLLSITTPTIRAFTASRLEAGASAAEINRELAVLKRMFTLAVQASKLHGKPHIPMLKENNVRRGFFERDQFEAVRDKLAEPLRPVATFAYLTGWRVGSEILPLEWRQVDWQGRTVRLDPGTTKSGEGRTYPFTADLEAVLVAQKAVHDGLRKAGVICPYVFHRDGTRISSLRKAWLTACEKAGVPGRLLHDFRRTAVRNLEKAGVSRSAAMAMVGHKTEAIYRRYAIVDAGALRDAATRIDNAAGTLSGTLGTDRGVNTKERSA